MSFDYLNQLDIHPPPSPPDYNPDFSQVDPILIFDPDNPLDYNPDSLMFTDPTNDYPTHYDNAPQLSVTPAQGDLCSFDYSSPSSSGAPDSHSDTDRPIRSRASSVASNHVPHHSPRFDVAQTFENMRFESPAWQNTNLPPVDRPLSPSIKPQSPPQLRIPASPTPSAPFQHTPPPTINAPAGDGGVTSGPQLHIVPATPISGGGAAQTQPFQNRIEALRQMHSNRQSAWSELTLQEESQPVSQLPPFSDQSQQQQSAPYAYSPDQNQITNDYLYPSPPRLRSKSDTQLQPLNWNSPYPNQDRNDSSTLDGTSNLNDLRGSPSHQLTQLPRHPASADSLHTTFNIGSSPAVFAPPSFTFGGPSPSNNAFLSPDVSLRRSKSDAGSRPGHQRLSRSEDIRSPSLLFPPPSTQQQQQDFMHQNQYLSPQEPIPPIRGGAHHRRASSGSRYGFNSGVDRSDHNGLWSSSSSARASPYPSPNASPRVHYDELPTLPSPRYLPPPEDTRTGLGLDMSGGTSASQESRGRSQSKTGADADVVSVAKPTVTTGRTANASHKRRKQEATFVCPIPKCGSTFTRSFNLRGHLRSHNEERPFQCHWPGCGKGFARQHDCKRHEQLHTNYRPYTCEGCNKPFARMDALNRHLRSEGGAECQKSQQASARNDYDGSGQPLQPKRRNQAQPAATTVPKTEADTGNWSLVL